MMIKTTAYARAGLVGNPSDGYNGKTISIIIRNFAAQVTLWESPELEIRRSREEQRSYSGIEDLLSDLQLGGYYGGERLVKAIIRRFAQYCSQNGIRLEPKNFTLCYESDIPRRVGLAGSSAIVTAALRALMQFYGVSIPLPLQPGLILSAEKDELGIGAGLQDRVIQSYEGVVYMDFAKELMDRQGHGNYVRIDHALLPPLFVAYDISLSEGSEVFHNNIRERYDRGEEKVVRAMLKFAELTERAREALLAGRPHEIGRLMSENFDTRRSIYQLSSRNIEMIEIARKCGAHAKFAGSGGAAIGTYCGRDTFERLQKAYREAGFEVLEPAIVQCI